MVSTLSSITVNFAIAAPPTHSLKSGQGEFYQRWGQYQGKCEIAAEMLACLGYAHVTGKKPMELSARQREVLCRIRDLEISGQIRFVYDREADELWNVKLVEKQSGLGPSYRLTAKGRKALEASEQTIALMRG